MVRSHSSHSDELATSASKTQPLVSAIIPVRNAESTIERAIRSALQQTYPHIEIIVVDDGSNDNTASVASTFANRATVIRQEHGGVASARNRAIAASNGSLIANLDSDDHWAREKIEHQVAVMRADPSIGALGVSRFRVRNGRTTTRRNRKQGTVESIRFTDQLFRSRVCSASMMMRREHLKCHGGYDENLPAYEDYDLWLRLMSHNVKVATYHQPLYYFHEHDQSMRSCCDLMHNALIAFIEKWERRRNSVSQCSESIFEDAFCWWLFKAAVQYRRKGRSDLCRLALEQAASRGSNWRIRSLVRTAQTIPSLLSIANQARPFLRATG